MGRSKRLPRLSLDGHQQSCTPDLSGFARQSSGNKDSRSTTVPELTPISLTALRQFFEILDRWDLCMKEESE
jgi:hypothetical protein